MTEQKVIIAIATFMRPDGLQGLLVSLEEAIANVHEYAVDVLVVDNDPKQSARGVCARSRSFTMRYIPQPEPGISATRNAAIKAAAGSDFIVFVDDDEIVSSRWLVELLSAQAETRADMVAGPVFSVLPPETPSSIRESGLFERPERADLTDLIEAGAGNLLCRYSLFENLTQEAWFSSEYSFSGGEDAELTRRLHREGAKIVWAARAAAWEEVTPQRATFLWLARRHRRIGATDFRLGTHGPLRGILRKRCTASGLSTARPMT